MLKKLALMLAIVGVCCVALPACGDDKAKDKDHADHKEGEDHKDEAKKDAGKKK